MNGNVHPSAALTPARRWSLLAILFLVSTSNYVDRYIISVLLEPIKAEFGASDTQMGLLSGIAFAFFYATLGIPVARWADRGNRRHIIVLALSVWSVATALCGVAASFSQLLLARIGVGAGEAGSMPPAQSLIADYFPPEHRGRALAVLTSSSTIGYIIAFVGGASLVTHYGWRVALMAVGLPGLILALVVWFLLLEPREAKGFELADRSADTRFADTVRVLMRKRSYVAMTIAVTLYGFVAYGVVVFFPSYMIRHLGVSLKDVSVGFGLLSAAAALIGTLAGGWATDRLSRLSLAWCAWLPSIAAAVALPLYVVGFTSSYGMFLGCTFVAGILLSAALPCMFAGMHAVCGAPRRAVAVSLMLFLISMIGAGLGPFVTGALSDLYASSFDGKGLRAALLTCISMLLPCAAALYVAGRLLPADVEP